MIVGLAALVAGAVAAAVIVAAPGDNGQRQLRGGTPPPGIALPEFELPDHRGQLLRSADLAGKAILVTFLDTQCTDACPIIASVIGQALARLDPSEREKVAAIAISTDPDGDTTVTVDRLLRRNRVEGVLRYLVAPVETLRPIWQAFQISASFDTGNDSLHSAPVRLFNRDGIWVSTQHPGADLTAENLAHDLRTILRGD